MHEYFEREVRPLLIPVGLDPAHPFPQVANKSLNFIVRLGGKDAFGRENEIAIVKVPRVLPRLIRMPPKVAGKKALFVSLSSVIRAHLEQLFPGREVGQFSQFRVTRHSDLAVDEDDVRDLRTALRLGLQQRHYGQAVRLEVSSGCSDYLAEFLLQQFRLPEQALYRVHGPVNLVRLAQLIDLVDAPHLLFPPYKPSYPAQLVPGRSFFEQMKRKDILIHQPFESFEGVLGFLREAVYDPKVLAIKQTIYRTGTESELMDLLREAVRRGKEVSAVVELKARFDEEVNINWAESLEAIGAQVVYGVVGLKTHAKMLLVTRREGKQLIRYAHLSTGNYNPRTAKLYTDLSVLTADPTMTADIENVFFHLASHSRLPRLHHLWLAPFHLQRKLIDRIDALGEAAAAETRGPHRSEDERVDRPAADAGAGSRRAAGREDRPHRPRRLHAAGAVARGDGQYQGALGDRALPGAFEGVLFPAGRRGTALPVQRRLDEPQHAAPRRTGLAGDRCQPAPADRGRVPGGLPAGRPGRLGPDAGRALQARQGSRRAQGPRSARRLDGALCRARRSRAGGNMDLILWRHAEAQDEDRERR